MCWRSLWEPPRVVSGPILTSPSGHCAAGVIAAYPNPKPPVPIIGSTASKIASGSMSAWPSKSSGRGVSVSRPEAASGSASGAESSLGGSLRSSELRAPSSGSLMSARGGGAWRDSPPQAPSRAPNPIKVSAWRRGEEDTAQARCEGMKRSGAEPTTADSDRPDGHHSETEQREQGGERQAARGVKRGASTRPPGHLQRRGDGHATGRLAELIKASRGSLKAAVDKAAVVVIEAVVTHLAEVMLWERGELGVGANTAAERGSTVQERGRSRSARFS